MIWLLLTMAVLAWPSWEVWRWGLARRVYTSQEPPALTITPRHVQALRKLRIESILADMPRLQPDGYFRFTDQHRRLLHKLRLEWPDKETMWFIAGAGYPAPAVHFQASVRRHDRI
jgi:hypothetical protein